MSKIYNFSEKKEQIVLVIIFLVGLILRISIIDDYSLSEDEVLKIHAVKDYLHLDFSGNIQHPAISKLLMSLSVLIFGESTFAIRLPNAVVGALTIYPIYYLGKELVGRTTGLISSLLWSVDIPAISFTTIAKEDALLTFFWVLTVYLFIQIEKDRKYITYSAITLGLALASKYTAILLGIYLLILYGLSWYYDGTVKVKDVVKILPITAITFAFANFPMFLPQSFEGLYNHYYLGLRFSPPRGGYIMMDELYPTRPLFFLSKFLVLKLTIPIIIFFGIGLITMSKHNREKSVQLLAWIMIILIVFASNYGYTRYVLVIIPAILIFTAYGIQSLSDAIWTLANTKIKYPSVRPKYLVSLIVSVIWIHSLVVGLSIAPYYRMYVNEFGGGYNRYGYYYPQDSVYDYKVEEAIEYINVHADINATVAIDVVIVAEYYGRSDLSFVYLVNQPRNVSNWDGTISYVIVQQSRIYSQNQQQISYLRETYPPIETFEVVGNTVVEIYEL